MDQFYWNQLLSLLFFSQSNWLSLSRHSDHLTPHTLGFVKSGRMADFKQIIRSFRVMRFHWIECVLLVIKVVQILWGCFWFGLVLFFIALLVFWGFLLFLGFFGFFCHEKGKHYCNTGEESDLLGCTH